MAVWGLKSRSVREVPVNQRDSYHMTPDQFRTRGREVVDWIASYMERVEDFPVLSQVQPGEIRARLPELPPETGEPFESVLDDLTHAPWPKPFHPLRQFRSG